jgi:hypothetical protein
MRKVIKNPYLILKTCLRDVSRRGGISFLYWNQLTKFKENKEDDTKKEGFNA